MQEVIVYRNPAEAAVWGILQDNPEIVLGLLLWLVLFFTLASIGTRIVHTKIQWNKRKNYDYAVIAVSGVIAALISYLVI